MPDIVRPDLIADEWGPWGEYLELIQSRPAWHADAACKEAPETITWFADSAKVTRAAQEVCRGCLALEECRTWALGQGPDLKGLWGGLTENERAKVRRGQRAA